ncbi:MAG TPA: phage baseplate assembly protein V [Kofleriaceae bacterium]|jgi:uncharacterized protein involved in type VI secretion and phage assembly|nr:phage baseplate assembly protein V [Kofleriaceae bacterium]
MRNSEAFVIGKITNVTDPLNSGRVQVRYPHLDDTLTEWSSVSSIMAGGGRGCFFMPEIDDEVLVAPQQGDWNHPFVIGFVWNPVQLPPAQDHRQRMICSTNQHKLIFLDSTPTDGNQGGIVITDAHGNMITMTDWGMSIYSPGTIRIDGTAVNIMGRPVKVTGGPI